MRIPKQRVLTDIDIYRSFLFAYDTGIVGGILTLKSFQRDSRYSHYSRGQITQVNSNSVSVLQAGAFFGCFFIWPVAARFGRRWSLLVSSIVFIIGAILQVINSHSLPVFYVGRVISGIGIGSATVLIPYIFGGNVAQGNSWKAGQLLPVVLATGVMTSYWVDYGVAEHVPSVTRQWQIPLALQMIPGGLVGLGVLRIKESSRWLAKRGRHEEALESLVWVRGGDKTPDLMAEYAEILKGIEEEVRATEGVTWRECLLPANRCRLFIAVSLQLCQQLTGNTSLAYYAPQIFATVGAGNSKNLVAGFFGVIKVLAVASFVTFLSDRIGRKTAFMGGAAGMGACMLIIAIVVATHPPDLNATSVSSASAASIAMVYLEAAAFNLSWGPVAWLYLGEIMPNRIREFGVALGAASQWLFNFMMSQITPHAVENIGWRTFLMFAIFNAAIVVYSWWVLGETRGKSLEEMETVFGSEETAFDVEAARRKALDEEEREKTS